MIRRRTTFVIGAGAGVDIRMPTGPALLSTLKSLLDVQFNGSEVSNGDPELWEALGRLCGGSRIMDYVTAARRLVEAADTAPSIDNAIDQNDHIPLVSVVGKHAITKAIINAERISKLSRSAPDRSVLRSDDMKDTWFWSLGRILCQDCKGSKPESIFENVSFITFNYDRSLEFFLPFYLVSAFGLPLEAARGIVDKVTIVHAYGSLGLLPWQTGNGHRVDFGGQMGENLSLAANELRTFTENIEDREDLAEIRGQIAYSDQIVFLGFGFHPQNMQLLGPPAERLARTALATIYKVPHPAVSIIKSEVKALLQPGMDPPNLTASECKEALDDYAMALMAN